MPRSRPTAFQAGAGSRVATVQGSATPAPSRLQPLRPGMGASARKFSPPIRREPGCMRPSSCSSQGRNLLRRTASFVRLNRFERYFMETPNKERQKVRTDGPENTVARFVVRVFARDEDTARTKTGTTN